MTQRFANKRAIVTGGTSGIGREIVTALCAQGATVLFTGTHAERGAAVASATGARFLRADARLPDIAQTVVATATGDGEGIDILINNAGGLGSDQDVVSTTREAFSETVDVHLWAPWQLMAAVAPEMKKRGGGAIINMASVAGQRVGAASVAYSVAKAGMIHLTRCAAAEFGADNIRVNSVSPGFIETGIHSGAMAGDAARKSRFVEGLGRIFSRKQAIGRPGQTRDISETVLHLASDASAFMTGTDIVVDGGLMWGRAGLLS